MNNNKNLSYNIQSSNIYKSPPELVNGENNLRNSLFTDLINSRNNYFTIKNYGFNNDSEIKQSEVNYKSNVQSLNDCINECNNIEICDAYSYNDNSNKCTLHNKNTSTLIKKNESTISGYNTNKNMNASSFDLDDINNIQTKIGAQYLIQKNNNETFQNKSNNNFNIENFIGDSLGDCLITKKNFRKLKIQVEINYNKIKKYNFNDKDIYKLCLRYNSSTVECFENDINNIPLKDIPYKNNKKKFIFNFSLTGSKINNIQLYIGNQSINVKEIKMFFYIGNYKIRFVQQKFNKLLKIGYHTLNFSYEKDFTNLRVIFNGNTEYINLMNDMTLNRIIGYGFNDSCDITKIPNININDTLNQKYNNNINNKKYFGNIEKKKLFMKETYKYNQYNDKLNSLFNKKNKDNNKYIKNFEKDLKSIVGIKENFKNKCDSIYFNNIILSFIVLIVIGILILYFLK